MSVEIKRLKTIKNNFMLINLKTQMKGKKKSQKKINCKVELRIKRKPEQIQLNNLDQYIRKYQVWIFYQGIPSKFKKQVIPVLYN